VNPLQRVVTEQSQFSDIQLLATQVLHVRSQGQDESHKLSGIGSRASEHLVLQDNVANTGLPEHVHYARQAPVQPANLELLVRVQLADDQSQDIVIQLEQRYCSGF